jgi:predicted metal-binding membrane protein
MPQPDMPIDARNWRRHLPAVAGLGAVTALSWLYLVRMNAAMPQGGMAAMPAMPASLPAQLFAAGAMWSIMMVAMMLPTALPAVTVFDNLTRRRGAQTGSGSPTALFVASYLAGYVAVWTGYSAVAAVGQVVLARAALLTPMLQSASIALSAAILLAAGAFQFTSLKDACLTKCRTPFAFFLAEWRDGKAGALVLGLKHGSYCVGCCWALMAVMFVVDAMNLL